MIPVRIRRAAGVFFVVWLAAVHTAAQTVMLDGTGSMASPDKVETALVDALAGADPFVSTFGISIFSASAFGAEIMPVEIGANVVKSRIDWVNRRRLADLHDELRVRLAEVLSKPRPEVAEVTDLQAVFARAATEDPPVLVVTDAKDETGKKLRKIASGDGVFVVVCPAKDDNVSRELETFNLRVGALRQVVPSAHIYGCHQIRQAVRDWAAPVVVASPVLRVSQQIP